MRQTVVQDSWSAGCSAATCDRQRPSSPGRREGLRKVTTSLSASWWGCARPGKRKEKKKGTRQLSTLSAAPAASRPAPRQRHIPSTNGQCDQRGIPLSLSRRTQPTGAKDGGHTAYSAPPILIRAQWSLTLCQLPVCVLKHPELACIPIHTHRIYTRYTPSARSLCRCDPVTGGARFGICSRPAVESPANGRA